MKKSLKLYVIIWAILLVIFNVICFVTPDEIEGMNKFGSAFWAGYIFITLAFVGQLICSCFTFKTENLQKIFYRMPLITVSYIGLILTIVFGAACMAIPDLPNWVGIIVCLLILAFTVIAVLKAKIAVDIVEKTDTTIIEKQRFIRELTSRIEEIMNYAKSEESKAECKKVFEAIRYSDPVSSPKLYSIETEIQEKIEGISRSTEKDDTDRLRILCEETILLIKERNGRCKGTKQS